MLAIFISDGSLPVLFLVSYILYKYLRSLDDEFNANTDREFLIFKTFSFSAYTIIIFFIFK